MNKAAPPTIRISEIFGPTIQGEGALIGKPTVFIRTGGCDYRCTWCDTMHAVDSKFRNTWTDMSPNIIMDKVNALSGNTPIMITLSGGNPAIQPLKPLINLGHAQGHNFAIETQGSIAQYWFKDLAHLTLSPKPPSSGMEYDGEALKHCISAAGKNTNTRLKFVIKDADDYAFAKSVWASFPSLPVYLQPCNTHVGKDQDPDTHALWQAMRDLSETVIRDKWYAATILPQLHVMMWGNQKGV